MSDPFIGQIMITPYSFAPRGFAQCNGQLLPVTQNQALFALLGTRYGGNGTANFQLPNLQGRTPYGMGISQSSGTQYPIGQSGGSETVTLTNNQLPAHTHMACFSASPGTTRGQANGLFGNTGTSALYTPYTAGSNQVPLAPGSVSPDGGGQPHSNMQPYSVLNFCIALVGIYPTRG